MPLNQAIRAARRARPQEKDSIEITLEALRQLGIDLNAPFDGETIEDYVRAQAYHFRLWEKTGKAPMYFLKHHVILGPADGAGKSRFHH
ncbi:MAG: hypothetical protein ACK5JR_14160 [Tropicimonas sp.]|uniref:hypothetical protein n=1 Tax=Tropicimonas sp. TaxID=2067044 RepID=UPI003A8A2A02